MITLEENRKDPEENTAKDTDKKPGTKSKLQEETEEGRDWE